MIKSMHVLVTGCSGLIGHGLVKRFLKEKFKIIGTFNKTKPSINSLNSNDSLKILQVDLTDFSKVQKLFEENLFDAVFHLAGQTLRKDNSDADIYFQSNFLTTLNLLEACRRFNVKKFIFSSSIAVYGLSSGQNIPEYFPVDENHQSTPFDFYDLSKSYAENLCQFYHKRFQINCTVLRYSRVSSPVLQKGFIYQVIKNALLNNPIQINGDVSTDFVHINDVVESNILALKSNGFEIYNIGSGEEKTLLDIANQVIKITKSSSKIKFNDKEKSKFVLDVTKAEKKLGYSPTSIEQMLRDVIQYIKKISDI